MRISSTTNAIRSTRSDRRREVRWHIGNARHGIWTAIGFGPWPPKVGRERKGRAKGGMRTDKNGKRLPVHYCSCGHRFVGNGAWTAHRRKRDRTCHAATLQDFVAAIPVPC